MSKTHIGHSADGSRAVCDDCGDAKAFEGFNASDFARTWAINHRCPRPDPFADFSTEQLVAEIHRRINP